MPYNKKRHVEADSDGEQQVVKKPKNQKQAKKDLSKGTDGEGNPFWEIGTTRRISTSQYKGATLVNIREYYTAPDGDLRPGKKGISLALDQYNALLKVIPELNETLRSQGHAVGEAPAEGPNEPTAKAERPGKPKKSAKANIDATSDEEEAGEEDE